MRCWKLPKGQILVETDHISRLTRQDHLPSGEQNILLCEVNARIAETGQTRPIYRFCRYYEVDSGGLITESHEDYACSDEDDLHSWGYRVIGDQLWEFAMVHTYGEEPRLNMRHLLTGLVPTDTPSNIRS